MSESPLEFGLTKEERELLEEQVINGAEAERILSSPLLKLAFDAAELDEHKIIANSNDPEEVKQACDMIKAYAKVRRKLTNVARRGSSARQSLAEDEER